MQPCHYCTHQHVDFHFVFEDMGSKEKKEKGEKERRHGFTLPELKPRKQFYYFFQLIRDLKYNSAQKNATEKEKS